MWNWEERRELFSSKRGERMLTVRKLRPGEAELAVQLQDLVHQRMPDPSLLALTDRWEIEESVDLDVCLGVFDGENLAAFGLMVVNRNSPQRNTGQKNAYPWQECVSVDTIFVHPDYRGLGLQSYLLSAQDAIARQLGAKYALVTVAPNNEYSLRNVLNQGFEIIARKQLYGGLDRYVLKKNLR